VNEPPEPPRRNGSIQRTYFDLPAPRQPLKRWSRRWDRLPIVRNRAGLLPTRDVDHHFGLRLSTSETNFSASTKLSSVPLMVIEPCVGLPEYGYIEHSLERADHFLQFAGRGRIAR